MPTSTTQESADGYLKMASIVQAAFDDLLQPLESTRDAKQLLESTTTEAFFRDFLFHADAFAENSSLEFAKTLRQYSSLPDLRGSPTSELAKQIRKVCFGRLDAILGSYLVVLRDVNFDMSRTNSQLEGGSVVDAAIHGAALGQLAAGFGELGKRLGAFNAIAKGANQLQRQGALAAKQLELLKRAKWPPCEKIAECLDATRSLPEELLDYGCAKCFGSQVDFDRQKGALALVRQGTAGKLLEIASLVKTLPGLEEQLLEKKAALNALKLIERSQQENQARASKYGVGVITPFLVVLILVCISTGYLDKSIVVKIGCLAAAAIFSAALAALLLYTHKRGL